MLTILPSNNVIGIMPDDNILNGTLNSFENQPTNTGIILHNIKREIQLIKQKLSTLETVLPDIRNDKEMGDQSAAVQLILSNKRIGWKAAFRELLTLKYGVVTISKSCATGRKNAKYKLDERKLQHLKSTYTFHNLTNLIMLYYLKLIYSPYGGESDLTPLAINTVINSARSVARTTLKNTHC